MESSPEAPEGDESQQLSFRVVQAYLARRLNAEAPGALLTLYWDEFYQVYAPVVTGVVMRYVTKAADRDDLVQEVWMTVAAKLPEFEWRENRGGLRMWLTTVIRNRTLDLLRKQRRRDIADVSSQDLP